MFVFLFYASTVGLVEIHAQSFDSRTTPNNFELLTMVGDSLVKKVLSEGPVANDSTSFLLYTSNGDSLNWFIENRLSSYLLKSGFKVYRADTDSASITDCNNYILQFNTIEIGIRYRVSSNGSELERTALLRAGFKIVNCQSKEVLLNNVFTERKTDWINASKKEELESRSIDFTIGKIVDAPPTVKFKPFIITAVTGTIVYLFYALRSR